jgi:hypothetical protein
MKDGNSRQALYDAWLKNGSRDLIIIKIHKRMTHS